MSGPDKIMVIRHAEKPGSVEPTGVDENGVANLHSLTVRGWQRAGALVRFFCTPSRPGIARPTTIVASAHTDVAYGPEEVTSRRSEQTVMPLRDRVRVDYWGDIHTGDEDLLVERLKQTKGVVLVAWTHKRIHNIIAPFVESLAPDWDGTCFDAVWILDRKPDGGYTLRSINQDLLAGDAPSA